MPSAFRFDRSYYERHYEDPDTRVASQADIDRLGAFVCAYLAHLRQPVTRVLDVGCGLGLWRSVIARHFPRASYLGVEASEHACARLGWTHASVVDFTSEQPFDLVICQGVLQYLDDRECARALANLARLTRGALYLEALTRRDWREVCDRDATDGNVHLRSGAWYRTRLARRLRAAGGGVFLSKRSPAQLYELEHFG